MVHEGPIIPIVNTTLRAVFDMCQFDLKTPLQNQPIQKRTQVFTTSPLMFQALDKRKCLSNHQHAHIQGNVQTKTDGTIRLSKYTASYTSTFAAAVVRAIQAAGHDCRRVWSVEGERAADSVPHALCSMIQEAFGVETRNNQRISNASTAIQNIMIKRRRCTGKQAASSVASKQLQRERERGDDRSSPRQYGWPYNFSAQRTQPATDTLGAIRAQSAAPFW